MTQLQLVEIDPTPGGNGLPEIRTVKAVSSSWSSLKKYCKDTFKTETGMKTGARMWDKSYVIEQSKIVIVREGVSKFDE